MTIPISQDNDVVTNQDSILADEQHQPMPAKEPALIDSVMDEQRPEASSVPLNEDAVVNNGRINFQKKESLTVDSLAKVWRDSEKKESKIDPNLAISDLSNMGILRSGFEDTANNLEQMTPVQRREFFLENVGRSGKRPTFTFKDINDMRIEGAKKMGLPLFEESPGFFEILPKTIKGLGWHTKDLYTAKSFGIARMFLSNDDLRPWAEDWSRDRARHQMRLLGSQGMFDSPNAALTQMADGMAQMISFSATSRIEGAIGQYVSGGNKFAGMGAMYAGIAAGEAGNFGLETVLYDIDETDARFFSILYGLGSGAIELHDELYRGGTKFGISNMLESMIGGASWGKRLKSSLMEGAEEFVQNGLQTFLMGLALSRKYGGIDKAREAVPEFWKGDMQELVYETIKEGGVEAIMASGSAFMFNALGGTVGNWRKNSVMSNRIGKDNWKKVQAFASQGEHQKAIQELFKSEANANELIRTAGQQFRSNLDSRMKTVMSEIRGSLQEGESEADGVVQYLKKNEGIFDEVQGDIGESIRSFQNPDQVVNPFDSTVVLKHESGVAVGTFHEVFSEVLSSLVKKGHLKKYSDIAEFTSRIYSSVIANGASETFASYYGGTDLRVETYDNKSGAMESLSKSFDEMLHDSYPRVFDIMVDNAVEHGQLEFNEDMYNRLMFIEAMRTYGAEAERRYRQGEGKGGGRSVQDQEIEERTHPDLQDSGLGFPEMEFKGGRAQRGRVLFPTMENSEERLAVIRNEVLAQLPLNITDAQILEWFNNPVLRQAIGLETGFVNNAARMKFVVGMDADNKLDANGKAWMKTGGRLAVYFYLNELIDTTDTETRKQIAEMISSGDSRAVALALKDFVADKTSETIDQSWVDAIEDALENMGPFPWSQRRLSKTDTKTQQQEGEDQQDFTVTDEQYQKLEEKDEAELTDSEKSLMDTYTEERSRTTEEEVEEGIVVDKPRYEKTANGRYIDVNNEGEAKDIRLNINRDLADTMDYLGLFIDNLSRFAKVKHGKKYVANLLKDFQVDVPSDARKSIVTRFIDDMGKRIGKVLNGRQDGLESILERMREEYKKAKAFVKQTNNEMSVFATLHQNLNEIIKEVEDAELKLDLMDAIDYSYNYDRIQQIVQMRRLYRNQRLAYLTTSALNEEGDVVDAGPGLFDELIQSNVRYNAESVLKNVNATDKQKDKAKADLITWYDDVQKKAKKILSIAMGEGTKLEANLVSAWADHMKSVIQAYSKSNAEDYNLDAWFRLMSEKKSNPVKTAYDGALAEYRKFQLSNPTVVPALPLTKLGIMDAGIKSEVLNEWKTVEQAEFARVLDSYLESNFDVRSEEQTMRGIEDRINGEMRYDFNVAMLEAMLKGSGSFNLYSPYISRLFNGVVSKRIKDVNGEIGNIRREIKRLENQMRTEISLLAGQEVNNQSIVAQGLSKIDQLNLYAQDFEKFIAEFFDEKNRIAEKYRNAIKVTDKFFHDNVRQQVLPSEGDNGKFDTGAWQEKLSKTVNKIGNYFNFDKDQSLAGTLGIAPENVPGASFFYSMIRTAREDLEYLRDSYTLLMIGGKRADNAEVFTERLQKTLDLLDDQARRAMFKHGVVATHPMFAALNPFDTSGFDFQQHIRSSRNAYGKDLWDSKNADHARIARYMVTNRIASALYPEVDLSDLQLDDVKTRYNRVVQAGEINLDDLLDLIAGWKNKEKHEVNIKRYMVALPNNERTAAMVIEVGGQQIPFVVDPVNHNVIATPAVWRKTAEFAEKAHGKEGVRLLKEGENWQLKFAGKDKDQRRTRAKRMTDALDAVVAELDTEGGFQRMLFKTLYNRILGAVKYADLINKDFDYRASGLAEKLLKQKEVLKAFGVDVDAVFKPDYSNLEWRNVQDDYQLNTARQQEESSVVWQERIVRSDLQANPDVIYLFGDNLLQKGLGGQAKEMRGEPNAIGIPTKKAPNNNASAFMTDDEYDSNVQAIDQAFAQIPVGKKIVIPSAGLGTGLARLEEKAPRTFAYLQQKLSELESNTAQQQPSKEMQDTFELLYKESLIEQAERNNGYINKGICNFCSQTIVDLIEAKTGIFGYSQEIETRVDDKSLEVSASRIPHTVATFRDPNSGLPFFIDIPMGQYLESEVKDASENFPAGVNVDQSKVDGVKVAAKLKDNFVIAPIIISGIDSVMENYALTREEAQELLDNLRSDLPALSIDEAKKMFLAQQQGDMTALGNERAGQKELFKLVDESKGYDEIINQAMNDLADNPDIVPVIQSEMDATQDIETKTNPLDALMDEPLDFFEGGDISITGDKSMPEQIAEQTHDPLKEETVTQKIEQLSTDLSDGNELRRRIVSKHLQGATDSEVNALSGWIGNALRTAEIPFDGALSKADRRVHYQATTILARTMSEIKRRVGGGASFYSDLRDVDIDPIDSTGQLKQSPSGSYRPGTDLLTGAFNTQRIVDATIRIAKGDNAGFRILLHELGHLAFDSMLVGLNNDTLSQEDLVILDQVRQEVGLKDITNLSEMTGEQYAEVQENISKWIEMNFDESLRARGKMGKAFKVIRQYLRKFVDSLMHDGVLSRRQRRIALGVMGLDYGVRLAEMSGGIPLKLGELNITGNAAVAVKNAGFTSVGHLQNLLDTVDGNEDAFKRVLMSSDGIGMVTAEKLWGFVERYAEPDSEFFLAELKEDYESSLDSDADAIEEELSPMGIQKQLVEHGLNQNALRMWKPILEFNELQENESDFTKMRRRFRQTFDLFNNISVNHPYYQFFKGFFRKIFQGHSGEASNNAQRIVNGITYIKDEQGGKAPEPSIQKQRTVKRYVDLLYILERIGRFQNAENHLPNYLAFKPSRETIEHYEAGRLNELSDAQLQGIRDWEFFNTLGVPLIHKEQGNNNSPIPLTLENCEQALKAIESRVFSDREMSIMAKRTIQLMTGMQGLIKARGGLDEKNNGMFFIKWMNAGLAKKEQDQRHNIFSAFWKRLVNGQNQQAEETTGFSYQRGYRKYMPSDDLKTTIREYSQQVLTKHYKVQSMYELQTNTGMTEEQFSQLKNKLLKDGRSDLVNQLNERFVRVSVDVMDHYMAGEHFMLTDSSQSFNILYALRQGIKERTLNRDTVVDFIKGTLWDDTRKFQKGTSVEIVFANAMEALGMTEDVQNAVQIDALAGLDKYRDDILVRLQQMANDADLSEEYVKTHKEAIKNKIMTREEGDMFTAVMEGQYGDNQVYELLKNTGMRALMKLGNVYMPDDTNFYVPKEIRDEILAMNKRMNANARGFTVLDFMSAITRQVVEFLLFGGGLPFNVRNAMGDSSAAAMLSPAFYKDTAKDEYFYRAAKMLIDYLEAKEGAEQNKTIDFLIRSGLIDDGILGEMFGLDTEMIIASGSLAEDLKSATKKGADKRLMHQGRVKETAIQYIRNFVEYQQGSTLEDQKTEAKNVLKRIVQTGQTLVSGGKHQSNKRGLQKVLDSNVWHQISVQKGYSIGREITQRVAYALWVQERMVQGKFDPSTAGGVKLEQFQNMLQATTGMTQEQLADSTNSSELFKGLPEHVQLMMAGLVSLDTFGDYGNIGQSDELIKAIMPFWMFRKINLFRSAYFFKNMKQWGGIGGLMSGALRFSMFLAAQNALRVALSDLVLDDDDDDEKYDKASETFLLLTGQLGWSPLMKIGNWTFSTDLTTAQSELMNSFGIGAALQGAKQYLFREVPPAYQHEGLMYIASNWGRAIKEEIAFQVSPPWKIGKNLFDVVAAKDSFERSRAINNMTYTGTSSFGRTAHWGLQTAIGAVDDLVKYRRVNMRDLKYNMGNMASTWFMVRASNEVDRAANEYRYLTLPRANGGNRNPGDPNNYPYKRDFLDALLYGDDDMIVRTGRELWKRDGRPGEMFEDSLRRWLLWESPRRRWQMTMRSSYSPDEEDMQYYKFVMGLNGPDDYRLKMAYQKTANLYASAQRAFGLPVEELMRVSADGIPKW